MTDQHNLAKGVLINIVGLVTKTSRLAYLAVFSKFLGPELFGLYMLAYAISEVISKFSVLGLEGGMLKFSGQYYAQNKKAELRWILCRVLGCALLFSLIAAFGGWLLSDWISVFITQKPELTMPLKLFCLSIPGLSLTTVVLYSIRCTLDMRYENFIRSLFEPMAILAFGILFLKSGFGVSGLAWAHMIASLLAFTVSLISFFRLFPHSERPRGINWKDLFNTSIPMGGMSALNMFKLKLDLFFIGRFLPLSAVGIYSGIIEISQVLSKMKSLFDPVLVPMVQGFHEKIDTENFKKSLIMGFRWILTPIMGILGTMFLFPEAYLGFFGPATSESITTLRIYAVGQSFSAVFGILESILAITGFAYSAFFQLLIIIASNLLLLTIIVPKFGVIGAASVSAGHLVAVTSWRILFLQQKFKIHVFNKSLLKPIIAGAIATTAFGIFYSAYHEQSFLIKLFIGAGYIATYGYVLFKLGLEEVDHNMVKNIVAKVPIFKKLTR